jgi:glycine/D-amino acid oxidase-like deaminating enzyme
VDVTSWGPGRSFERGSGASSAPNPGISSAPNSASRPGASPGASPDPGARPAPGARPLLAASLWSDQLGPVTPRLPLDGDAETDVCVVGAGFTGLWTAYHLLRIDPGRRVCVVEREVAGFGASGRNGGWVSALFPAAAMQAAMRPELVGAVDDVGAVAAREGIACDYDKAGTLHLATTPAQAERLRRRRADGWMDAAAAAAIVRVAGGLGGVFDPDCAVVSPAKLVRGIADAVERRGGRIVEGTAALRIQPGEVVTDRGTVRAAVVVRATEAYTPGLPGLRRALAPVYSLVIATEPLDAAAWDEIGWTRRVTLGDDRHLIIYAQRTADGRIVLGGRGAPYHAGSRVRPSYDSAPAVFAHLERVLRALFPAAATARVTHRWGGPLGVPRDWTPSVTFDRATGVGSAGGYVGDGVAASALAGRTLAELISGLETPRTTLGWVGHTSPRWEPEPLRWLGVNGGRLLAAAADARENRSGRPSRLGCLVEKMTGH